MSYARMQLLKIGKKKVKVSFYLSVKQEWVVLHGFFFVFLQNKNELFFIRFEHYSYTPVYFTVENFSFLYSIIHPVSVPRWGMLDSPGKMLNFQNFSGVRPSSKFSTGEIRKPTGETTKPIRDDMKIQWGESINILLWLKNIYTWFTQKHINGWVTFKCQKILRKIALAIKSSLKV